jgi:hypothetical protein
MKSADRNELKSRIEGNSNADVLALGTLVFLSIIIIGP